MSDGFLHLLALMVSCVGMAALALSIEAHWRQVISNRASTLAINRALRAGSTALLLTSFYLCTVADRLAMAAIVWPMMLTVAAAIVAAGLSMHAQLKERNESR